jgi:putative transposase
MLVVEAKLKNGTSESYQKLDEAIRTSQFVRNSCVRYWMDNKGTTRNDLQKLCAVLASNKDTPWVNKLNSQVRQSAADRAWQSINRFYQNCRAKISGKKGFPRFKKSTRSTETDPNALGGFNLWIFSGDIENLSCLVERGISDSDRSRIPRDSVV